MILSDKHSYEKKDRYFSTGVLFSEVTKLAALEGVNNETILKKLKKSGIDYIFLEESTLQSLADNRYLDIIKCSEFVYKMYFYNPSMKEHIIKFFKKHGLKFQLRNKYSVFISLLDDMENNILNYPHGYSKANEKLIAKCGLYLGYILDGHSMLSIKDYKTKISYFGNVDHAYSTPLILRGENNSFSGINENHISAMINRISDLFICNVEFSKLGIVTKSIKKIDSSKILLTHTLKEAENQKYTIGRILPRWLRAVRERNNKMLLIKIFFKKSSIQKSPAQFNVNYIKNTLKFLSEAGFKKRKINFTSLKTDSKKRKLLLFVIYCIVVILFLRLFSDNLIAIIGTLLIQILLVVCYFYSYNKFLTGVGFFIANIGPLIGIFALISKEKINTLLRVILSLSVVILSGLTIHSLLFTLDYMHKVVSFKGVKIAFVFPLLFYALYLIFSKKDFFSNIRNILNKDIKIFHVCIIFFILSGGFLYLTRSGNFPLIPVHGLEIMLRDKMESILIARPRFKEFMLGYPCLFIWAICGVLKNSDIRSFLKRYTIFGVLIGYVSIINTFEHIHTPVYISVLRTFNSFVLGTMIFLFVTGLILTGNYIFNLTNFLRHEEPDKEIS